MKKVILFVSILFLLLIQSISAQNNFSVTLSGGYLHSAIDKAKLPYWENGFIVSLHSDYILSDNFSVFILGSYQQHFFNQNLVTFAVPAVVGYRSSVSGDNSSVFELSVGTKLFTLNDSRIRPYLGLGIGMLFINQGRVAITNWMEGSADRNTNLFANTDQNFNVAQINFGLGIEIEVVNNLNLVIDGKFVQSFDGLSYLPITVGIKFGL